MRGERTVSSPTDPEVENFVELLFEGEASSSSARALHKSSLHSPLERTSSGS
jgi:hypothetical protein